MRRIMVRYNYVTFYPGISEGVMKALKSLSFLLVGLVLFQAKSQAFNIERRVAITRQVLIDRMSSQAPIPTYLLNQAQCIAVMRNVKAGFIVGGEGSTGLVSCRLNGGWSAPSFLNTGGINFGFLIGGQVVDNVILFMTPYSRQMLNRGSVTLGGDLSFAMGPLGEGVGASLAQNSHLLVYSAGTGLYAGFSLNGTVMSHGDERNTMVYGRYFSPGQILATPAAFVPPAMKPFTDVLNYYSPSAMAQ
jgi:lipid-binding SYLF domain-containing protein